MLIDIVGFFSRVGVSICILKGKKNWRNLVVFVWSGWFM